MESVSFNGYIPVTYYARNPKTNQYVPVLKHENIRKCNSYVVRNLNKTAKKNLNNDFIELYKSIDKDYAKTPMVHSIYDLKQPVVYLVTGSDTDQINSMGKDLRLKKQDIFENTGNNDTPATQKVNKEFFEKTRNFLKNVCKRIKNNKGEKLTMCVFFEPKYTKKERKLIGFDYQNTAFFTNLEYNNPT